MPAPPLRTHVATESIFARMSRLAAQHGAVNLGQGFPSAAPPAFLLDAARRAVGHVDQYVPPLGLGALRDALGADLEVDGADVLVTCGATEALLVLALSLLGPGDEVVLLEPAYDVYGPQLRLAGATPVAVPMTLLQMPQAPLGWTLDLSQVAAAITPRTRALLLNSPHNPTGTVLGREELEQLVALARAHDLWLLSDEVYDELYYGGAPTPLRRLAPERTFTVGSAGKRLEATGWRVGWVVTPPGLVGALSGVRQITSFCAPAPLQAAVAAALPLARQEGFYAALRQDYAGRLALLSGGLRELGAQVTQPQGTYFLTVRHPSWQAGALVELAGVAVIPVEAFYTQQTAPAGVLRLAFCKSEAELQGALARLARFKP